MKEEYKVTVFSTPTCPWCFRVKDYLKENNINFKEIDVSTDEKAAMEMVNKSGQMGVPQIWVDDEIVVGYDEARLSQLLK